LGILNFSDSMGDYSTILIAAVFASMAYSMDVGGNMRKGARNMWAYSTVMFLGQWGLFILLGLYFFRPVFDTPDWFGMMLPVRSEEHTSELQSRFDLVCRILLEDKTETQTYQ